MIALVVGSAECAVADLEAIGPWPGMVVCVNEAAIRYPTVPDLWATRHPEKIYMWRVRANGRLDGVPVWSAKEPADHLLPEPWGGSSGLFGVQVALHLGATHVALAGIPMDARPHFGTDTVWPDWRIHQQAWETHRGLLEHVRSPSGWTRDLLSAPDAAWLAEARAAA